MAVGKTAELDRGVAASETIDARRFVVTPGFIDGHIHITGDPLTRGFARRAGRRPLRAHVAMGDPDLPRP